ncbi:hypothetical protein AB1286_21520 [Trinickia sp. NRRL B-1857]|uniref:hypothetical protein n=1 Tax=Trinickia sp. NRRL B-1857 TaxID=3162879 RepID=UPI003D2727EA
MFTPCLPEDPSFPDCVPGMLANTVSTDTGAMSSASPATAPLLTMPNPTKSIETIAPRSNTWQTSAAMLKNTRLSAFAVIFVVPVYSFYPVRRIRRRTPVSFQNNNALSD